MNFAYLILAHKNPDQLIRLIRRLQDRDSSFFIHLDRKSGEKSYSQLVEGLKDVPNLYFVKRYRCYWGAFNIVKATIALIDRLIESGVNFDYAFLLSGQDYLIKKNAEIKKYIARNNGKEFIESFSLHKLNC
ncbi:MAG: beta-1,6-N-acetylglucosaminyltransferase [Hydrococcus sp. RM1_1_31]|nr:beta-1,6-N-acetylglucosaminyltransferase [Hydrococcus sp. RM1_1_31]